jgi:hypothetical protein
MCRPSIAVVVSFTGLLFTGIPIGADLDAKSTGNSQVDKVAGVALGPSPTCIDVGTAVVLEEFLVPIGPVDMSRVQGPLRMERTLPLPIGASFEPLGARAGILVPKPSAASELSLAPAPTDFDSTDYDDNIAGRPGEALSSRQIRSRPAGRITSLMRQTSSSVSFKRMGRCRPDLLCRISSRHSTL